MSKHAHEMEAAGEARWSARRASDGLVMIKDLSSGEEHQAVAYSNLGDSVVFALPGESGPRTIRSEQASFASLKKAFEKTVPAEEPMRAKPAAEKTLDK